MTSSPRACICIDLKSFYASVECVERGLDPLTTNLVVADPTRTEKTICLAVTPALKAYGIPGRARLFEVVEAVRRINRERLKAAPGHRFTGSSSSAPELAANPSLSLDYIVAPPRMQFYIDYSARVYEIYLKYIAPEDIHPYSVDEIMCEATPYLKTYGMTAEELAVAMVKDIYESTGITATAGVGTNLYLAKVAMDILAKHAEPDAYGIRMASLDEMSYRRLLWAHRPITDFWRVGHGYARRLAEVGLYTMGDVARCSVGESTDYYNEDLLYKLFGVNAELLIDHAWGWEPCTMAEIKAYRPQSKCLSSGQVLMEPYTFKKARIVVHEMADALAMELVEKGLVTDQVVLTVGYDASNLEDSFPNPSVTDETFSGNSFVHKNDPVYDKSSPVQKKNMTQRKGSNASTQETKTDRYGRRIPKHAHGTENLAGYSSAMSEISAAALALYDRIVNPNLLIRRITIDVNHLMDEAEAAHAAESAAAYEQLDLFTDYEAREREKKEAAAARKREHSLQSAMLDIRTKYGKNTLVKGLNLEEGATALQRNQQIGGHKA
ncbi:MAG: DNA methylase [Lachnospiraceae bacterium]|nr:DNA methylase [Lachnospiraceae bacterium]